MAALWADISACWLSRLTDRPLGYENYERYTREQWFRRLRDEIRKLSSDERAEIMAMLREASRSGRRC